MYPILASQLFHILFEITIENLYIDVLGRTLSTLDTKTFTNGAKYVKIWQERPQIFHNKKENI
jgi:hypothetical protein